MCNKKQFLSYVNIKGNQIMIFKAGIQVHRIARMGVILGIRIRVKK